MNPVWSVARTNISYPPLTSERDADTVIIGGGITGMATALKLVEAGQRVIVLEALRVADGSTGRSTGNLYGTLSSGLARLRERYDTETARMVVRHRMQAIDFVEETVERLNIDCEFTRRPMYLCVRGDAADAERRLEEECKASTEAGLACIPHTSDLPFAVHRAVRLENQAQFNPLSYVQGLARAVAASGGQIFEHSRATQVDASRGVVTTASGRVRAKNIVYATHTPKGINLLQAEMQPYLEYGVAATVSQPESARWPDGIFWVLDDSKSIRSYRHGERQYLLVIGGKHKTGHSEKGAGYYQMLKDYAMAHFDVTAFDYQWSAQQFIPADQLPYIGQSAHRNIHVGTGFAADGLTWGVVAADILSHRILQGESGEKRYNPWRFTPLKSGKNWFEENRTVATHWLKGRFSSGESDSLHEVAPGEGKVLDIRGDKLAVHRATDGELTVLSAECPHMKCLVHWNGADSTWDCPCHGSRFSVEGQLLEGPAYEGLAVRDLATEE